MPVYSMTGFASAQHSAAAVSSSPVQASAPTARLALELRSVNSRFLDLAFRLPEDWRHHEPALRELLGKRLKRGKVELRAFIEATAASALQEPPLRTLQRLAAIQEQVRAWLPQAAPLSVAEAMRLAASEGAADASLADALLPLAEQALADLVAARAREGARLAALLHERLTALRARAEQAAPLVPQLVAARAREGARLAALLHERLTALRALAEQAAPLVPQLVDAQRQRFLDRWQEALGGAQASGAVAEAAQERALAEATAFAIRIDVAEELGRLTAHLDEIERVLKKGGETGKRLDFLIQELHREANTLGSKSATLELTRISVEMKVLIEQMREQVQNLE